MDIRNRFLIYSLAGTILGMAVGIAMWILAQGNPEGRSFVIHIIASGIHGLIPCGAVIVYELESWGLTKSTVVHASITLATILLIDLPMKWFSPGREFVLAMAIYVVLYAIIWLCNYMYYKRTVREINDRLNIMLSKEVA